MAFWGKEFMWNSVHSAVHGLEIVNFGTGTSDAPLGSDIEIFRKSVYRKPKPYLFGTSQMPVLEFPLTIGSQNYIGGKERDLIAKWLFGKQSYGILQVLECDIENVYFRCFLTDPVSVSAGNMNIAYQCTVVCDSPFAWEYPKTLTKTYGGGGSIDEDFTFHNASSNNDYQYPSSLTFSLNAIGSDFTITNVTDGNRASTFTGLSANETITIDNERQILSSDTGLRRLSNFNKNWFRLLPGVNNLNISGAISEFTMMTQVARKIGG